MLHLLPVKRWLAVVITLVGLLVLAAVYAGYLGTGDAIGDAKWIIRGAAPAASPRVPPSGAAASPAPCSDRESSHEITQQVPNPISARRSQRV